MSSPRALRFASVIVDQLHVALQFVGFGRRGKRDREPPAPEILEKLAYARERLHPRQILALEPLEPPLDHCFAQATDFVLRKKRREVLVGAFANVVPQIGPGELVSEMAERVLPRLRMSVDRVDERTVNIKHDCAHAPVTAPRRGF
ncbi:MAG TPA: hypothetical protein VFL57_11275 [Bryobacteraceae bacterium]|nr:hypothetical protein [Bryobacteraceae bacterium]